MSKKRYSVKLVARNEGICYVDDYDIYRFDVTNAGRIWTLYLPGSKGPHYETHDLDEDEKARVLPRIIKYLEVIWYFGVFPRRYSVVIENKKKY
jgi:hypothetical protein